MDRGRTPVRSILIVLLFVSGCYMTLEQRWAAFDAQMQQEIGVKTTEYYVAEWGKPARGAKALDGSQTWVWESQAYGGAQCWRKTLAFSPDGMLKEFHREYWPKESW